MSEHASNVAKTIMEQLGGHRFAIMTGAKYFSYDATGALTFRLPIGTWRACRITLNEWDLYDVKFWNWNDRRTSANYGKETRSEEHHSIYGDQLQILFESATELRTSLGTMGREQQEAQI